MRKDRLQKIFILLSSFVFILLLHSCTKDKGNIPAAPTTPISDSCTSNITYSQKIIPIINSACAISGCHVSTGFKDFSTYAALKSQLDAQGIRYFLSRIKPGDGIPSSFTTSPTSISSCDYNKIYKTLRHEYERLHFLF